MSTLDEFSWPSLLAAGMSVGERWSLGCGERERCHPGGNEKAWPRELGRANNSYCLPHSTYSPEENVLLVLFSPLLHCADSVLFILHCNWNKYVGDFKLLPVALGQDTERPSLPLFSPLPTNMLRASVFLPKDAVPQLDWMFLSSSEGLYYELTLTFVDASPDPLSVHLFSSV